MYVNHPCQNIRRRIDVVYPYKSLFLTLGYIADGIESIEILRATVLAEVGDNTGRRY